VFHFTIRDVLWLTVVVGLGVGWWIDHRSNASLRKAQRQLARLVELVEDEGLMVSLAEDSVSLAGPGVGQH
jgi:hypothetical protein